MLPYLYMPSSLVGQLYSSTLGRLSSRPLDVIRVGSAEHQSLTVLFGGHSRGTHQAAHVRLKTHIQHPVSLIQHKVPQLSQPNLEHTI